MISIPYAVASADGLLEEDRETVRCLLNSWQTHYKGNLLRSDYYEARNMLKDLGIAVPDSLRDLEVACGWGYKCVEVMRDHIAFDGFTCPDDEDFDGLLTSVAKRNKMATRVGKAVNSALKYCFSMLVVTADEDGHARISAYPPTLCTGIWDDVHECLSSGMFVVSFAKDRGRPTDRPDWVNVMLPDRMVRIREVRRNEWAAEYVEHGLGAVPMFVMPHNPDDDRPFGVSRINSEVRWNIDCAMRANVNEEIAAAFAASTQKYLLGTDGDAFADKTKWSAFIGSIFEVTKTEDGTIPQFGQLTQPSMQPMTEHFGNLCKRMSAATGIHVGQFGIMSDNPSSAEAIYAENEPLILKCKSFIREAKAALANAATAAIATELGCSYEEAEDACGVSVHFLNPAMPTLAQQTDSSIKLASAVEGFAGTPTFWRLNGLDDDEVRNVSSEIRRNVTRSAALDLMAGVTQAASDVEAAVLAWCRSHVGATVAEKREAAKLIMEGFVQGYDDVAAEFAAQWYDDLAERNGARLQQAVTMTTYRPESVDTVARYQAKKLVKGGDAAFARACGEYARNDAFRSLNETIISNVGRDRSAGVRFARVPTGFETCTFCIMLASRGAVYHTRKSAGEFKHFHRHCDCKVVPGFEDDPDAELVEGVRPEELREQWAQFKNIDEDESLTSVDKDAAKRAVLGSPGPPIVYKKPKERARRLLRSRGARGASGGRSRGRRP